MPPRPTPVLLAAVGILASALVATARGEDVDPAPPEGARLSGIAETVVPTRLDSGPVRAGGLEGGHRVVFEGTVGVPEAVSLRLVFDGVELAGEVGSGRESYLLITSLLDGHQQYLDARHLREWRDTSAYFNGDAVRVQLLAAPGTGENRVSVGSALISTAALVERSICGAVDDRVLSDDPRAGRIWPIGCSAWLFNGRQNCMLTAGHCGPNGSYVVQFNVPLSGAGGSAQHPGPDDQYAVDPASIQTNGGGGVGNDWAYFGVFDNSTTGLSPLQAAGGASYTLAPSAPADTGGSIRITGYGTTSAPVSPTWSSAQKTHAGPYTGVSGTTIRYATDTTGGNSGSGVEDESTGLTIGIHTHAGCTGEGGANQGTAIHHPALQAALANPLGACKPGLGLALLGTRPEMIDPHGGTSIGVSVVPDAGASLDPTTVTLHTNDGSGWVPTPMPPTADGFSGAFPPAPCGAVVSYYLRAEDSAGGSHALPAGAPAQVYSALAAESLITHARHDFETDPGWTVQNTALATGAWVRGVPGNFGRSDPIGDADGSGRCWVTGNTNAQDVDGGPTVLTSGSYDLSGAANAVLSYARWHRTDDASGADNLRVELSDDNGASWVLVESVPDTPGGWARVSVGVGEHVGLTDGVRVRFTVQDTPNDSVTESGVDDLRIVEASCGPGCSAADLNADGDIDLDDVDAFVGAFLGGSLGADVDGNGSLDLDDVDAFVAAFLLGC